MSDTANADDELPPSQDTFEEAARRVRRRAGGRGEAAPFPHERFVGTDPRWTPEYLINNALYDASTLPKEMPADMPMPPVLPDRETQPLLPADYYGKNPVVNSALSSALGVLPWLRDPANPQERMQLWPEHMVRSALTLPSDVMSGRVPIFDPQTGHVNQEIIDRAQDMAGLVMTGTAAGAPRGSTGAGPVRPPKVETKTYGEWKEALQDPVSKGELTVQPGPENKRMTLDDFTQQYVRDPNAPAAPEPTRRSFIRGVANSILSAPLRNKVATYIENFLNAPPGAMTVKAKDLFKYSDEDVSGYIDDFVGLIQSQSPKFTQFMKDNGLWVEEIAPVERYRVEKSGDRYHVVNKETGEKSHVSTLSLKAAKEVADDMSRRDNLSEAKVHFDPTKFKNIEDEMTKISQEYEGETDREEGEPFVSPEHKKAVEALDTYRESLETKYGGGRLNRQTDAEMMELARLHAEMKKHESPTWDKYGLGGDDDVDYHVGYPSEFIDTINRFLKARKKKDVTLGAGPTEDKPLPVALTSQPAPTWFTNIERELMSTKRGESKVPESATMEEWQQYLGKRVKPEEIKWLLRPDTVPPDQKFSRLEIAQRINAHKPQEHWKGDPNEDKEYYASHEEFSNVWEQWRSHGLPTFAGHQIADGVWNIIDQYGNVAVRHYEGTLNDVKGQIKTLTSAVDNYRLTEKRVREAKEARGLGDPDRLENAEGDHEEATGYMDDIARDMAHHKTMHGEARYGPQDYPKYTLRGGQNYQELVMVQPHPEYDPTAIPRHHSLDAARAQKGQELNALGRDWSNVVDELREIREMPQPMRILKAAREQSLQRAKNRFETEREVLKKELDKLNKQIDDLAPEVSKAVQARKDLYTSSHWDELNTMAHMRMDDRMVPDDDLDTQTLLAQEMQSDWHQAGQRYKYRNDPSLVRKEQVEEAAKLQDEIGASLDNLIHSAQPAMDISYVRSLANGLIDTIRRGERDPFHTPEEHALAKQFVEAGNEHARLRDQRNREQENVVPDAPYKATWPDLLLRRLLRKAVDEDYGAVGWVPGEEHQRRYNARFMGTSITYFPTSGKVSVLAHQYPRGWGGNVELGKVSSEAELAKLLGDADLAEYVYNNPGQHTLDEPREFVTQKGRRMESFYDKQLVDKMNAIVGKYGMKVEKREINIPGREGKPSTRETPKQEEIEPRKQEIFFVRLNDKARNDIRSKGFPLFSGGLIPVDGNPFDYDWKKSAAGALTNMTMQRGPSTPGEGDQWMKMFLPQPRLLQNNLDSGSSTPSPK